MKLVAILTPAYNREKTLVRLYESLCQQTSHNFTWYVVDDGSSDHTKELIENYKNEGKIDIRYFYQENRGKHFALNNGISKITEELTFIVDSDDYLLSNAIELIGQHWQQYRLQKNIAGIVFLRGYNKKEVIGDSFVSEGVYNYIDMRLKQNVSGDKAEIFKTKILQQYPFPEIQGEKFIGEDIVWNDIAKKYDMVWVNKIIYVTEYLEGGLTKSGRSLRVHCPIGGMLNSKMMLTHEFPLKFRIKKGILYNCYRHFMKKEDRAHYPYAFNVITLITVLPGYMLYLKWKKYY